MQIKTMRYLNHLSVHAHQAELVFFLFPFFSSPPFMSMTNMDLILNVWGKKINCFQVVCQAQDTETEHRILLYWTLPSLIFVCLFLWHQCWLSAYQLLWLLSLHAPNFSLQTQAVVFPQRSQQHRLGEGSLEHFQTNQCGS